MPVRLEKETVQDLVAKADAQPESTLAWEARRILANWLKEQGLDMDAATRKLIRDTLTRWGMPQTVE
ncbi:hypothetical protein [Hyalangium rubrum]|uniref:CopG family transcriptional regulator n=1 Tax=Hyalangium rubrum TaxID=3103134 RepID=A0ABU5GX22_9BACT|nr:hypothetical protein [Hyalangium sp. s54d21]MDY7225737.1 hypothetical protein [Hyalangium sp. s54d21]